MADVRVLAHIRNRFGVMGELFRFLGHRRLYWLIPFVIVLLIYGILMVVAQSTSLAPFIYTLF